jgi:hypothetical protein
MEYALITDALVYLVRQPGNLLSKVKHQTLNPLPEYTISPHRSTVLKLNPVKPEMKRTTVMIPEKLKFRADRRANAVGISRGAFICESLKRALKSDRIAALDDPYMRDDSVYDSDIPNDLAQNYDKHLYGD